MTVLDEIVDHTRSAIRERKRAVPIGRLEDARLFQRPRRSFTAALGRDGVSVIAEIKFASPSKGVLRDDVQVDSIALGYETAGAAAISVVTESVYFRGSVDFLDAASTAVSLPILRKDFVVDPYQIMEARAHGADAVLLIATVLERGHLRELLQAADEVGIDHLVEVYEERDLDRIDFDLVRTVGANNRDLTTFKVDVRRAGRVLRHVPNGVLRVAESGMSRADDIVAAGEDGADAVLVGEALMTSEDPGAALRAIMEELSGEPRVDDGDEDTAA